MNTNKQNSKFYVLAILLTVSGQNTFSQDTAKFIPDPTRWLVDTFSSSRSFLGVRYPFYRSPTKKDTQICEKFKNLITSEPNEKNYSDYYSLAESLWEFGRLSEAESMFLKIVNSDKKFYTNDYYHSSDLPGRKTTNVYGYGSFTSNYKNYACRYLTKIYIEQEKYAQALEYIEFADKKYVVKHNCGTGYKRYRSEIDGLYELCYYGLNMYDTILKKSMPNYYDDARNEILIKVIKKKFSDEEIRNYLLIAENTMEFILDTVWLGGYTIYDEGTKNEKRIESRWLSGTATMNLFGVLIELAEPSLKDGEIASKELFLKEFKRTRFYYVLSKEH